MDIYFRYDRHEQHTPTHIQLANGNHAYLVDIHSFPNKLSCDQFSNDRKHTLDAKKHRQLDIHHILDGENIPVPLARYMNR